MMLAGGQGQRTVPGPGPVNQAVMVVSGGDAMDIQEPRRNQRARARARGGRPFAEKLYFEAALLPRFPQRRRFGILVQLDVAAQRQPLVQLAMMAQQDLALVNDKD